MRGRAWGKLSWLAVFALLSLACGKETADRGGLMVVVEQGALELTHLRMEVRAEGKTLLDEVYRIPRDTTLPTTLAIVSSGTHGASVDITIAAWRLNDAGEPEPLDRRDITVTNVSTSRIDTLTVVLSERCSGTVKWFDGAVQTTCNEESTCHPVTGDCLPPRKVDASKVGGYPPSPPERDASPPDDDGGTPSSGDTSNASHPPPAEGGQTDPSSSRGSSSGRDTSTGSAGSETPRTSIEEPASMDGSDTTEQPPPYPSSSTSESEPSTSPTSTSGTHLSQSSGSGLAPIEESSTDGSTSRNGTDPRPTMDGSSSDGPMTDPSGSVDTSSPAVPDVCGDGQRGVSEQCDDGNQDNGDGCNEHCATEPGWSCDDECMPTCGDGLLRGAEMQAGRCDDGNRSGGDGCTADCNVEPGFTCGGEPYACSDTCGDGEIQPPEACDDGNTVAGDGCFACALEPGFRCETLTTPKRACGVDGNVYALDLCGNPAQRVEVCPGDCQDGACRCVIRVNPGGNDSRVGDSWTAAKRTIQAALNAAEANRCEVWVREGTYQPWGDAETPPSRDASFTLRPGVALYGGFRGIEAVRGERDWQAYPTTLFGGRANDEGPDGVHHVVVAAEGSSLDGFFVTGGQAQALETGDNAGCGGGLRVSNVSHEVRNVTFHDNRGVAVCVMPGSTVTFEDSYFTSNVGLGGNFWALGQALYGRESEVRIVRSQFSSHVGGTNFGGAIGMRGGLLVVEQSRFEYNESLADGGAVYCDEGCSLVVRDSHFLNNRSGSSQRELGGGAIRGVSCQIEVANSSFEGNYGRRRGGAIAVGSALLKDSCRLLVHNSWFVSNQGRGSGGGFGGAVLAWTSETTIVGSVFTANSTSGFGATGGALTIIGGGAQLVNNTIALNRGELLNSSTFADRSKGGALSVEGNAIVRLENSIIWGNEADEGNDVYVESGSLLSIRTSTFGRSDSCYPDTLACPVADPQFQDVGALHFTPTNPMCIDTGDIDVLPEDTYDLDSDGNTTESIPVDILGNPRVRGSAVDLGAIEVQ